MSMRYAQRRVIELVKFWDNGEDDLWDQAASTDDIHEVQDGEVLEVMPDGWRPGDAVPLGPVTARANTERG